MNLDSFIDEIIKLGSIGETPEGMHYRGAVPDSIDVDPADADTRIDSKTRPVVGAGRLGPITMAKKPIDAKE